MPAHARTVPRTTRHAHRSNHLNPCSTATTANHNASDLTTALLRWSFAVHSLKLNATPDTCTANVPVIFADLVHDRYLTAGRLAQSWRVEAAAAAIAARASDAGLTGLAVWAFAVVAA